MTEFIRNAQERKLNITNNKTRNTTKGKNVRTLAQIFKEDKVIAKLHFQHPIVKSKETYYAPEPIRYAKRNGARKPKLAPMIGEVK